MLAMMAAPGATVIDHPNREQATSRATRAIVVMLLLISAALLAIATAGGWEKLQSAKPVQVAYVLLYLGFAFAIAR